jgi:8-oxo-dGTP diphosphatase
MLIPVAAGGLLDPDGRVLIAQRPAGGHVGGFWEFPGGKIQAGESPLAALRRELQEELGIRVASATPLTTYQVAYPDRTIELHVFRVQSYAGEPRGLEGQPLRWIAVGELGAADLLPADRPVVEALEADLPGANPW